MFGSRRFGKRRFGRKRFGRKFGRHSFGHGIKSRRGNYRTFKRHRRTKHINYPGSTRGGYRMS